MGYIAVWLSIAFPIHHSRYILNLLSWVLVTSQSTALYYLYHHSRSHFYQTRSAWSVDQGSNKNHSPAYNFAPTVTKFCVMWEGLSRPHDTKFGNCRCRIVDSRAFPSWSLIHGLRWSGLIKAEPAGTQNFWRPQNTNVFCMIFGLW